MVFMTSESHDELMCISDAQVHIRCSGAYQMFMNATLSQYMVAIEAAC